MKVKFQSIFWSLPPQQRSLWEKTKEERVSEPQRVHVSNGSNVGSQFSSLKQPISRIQFTSVFALNNVAISQATRSLENICWPLKGRKHGNNLNVKRMVSPNLFHVWGQKIAFCEADFRYSLEKPLPIDNFFFFSVAATKRPMSKCTM